jgi:uncharacterized membrane protein YgcG
MAAPLLLAFMLIQAPNPSPQEFQAQPATRFEPVLATGIKVEVVEAPGVEAESYAAATTPVSMASFVGVVPRMNPCRWAAAGFGGRLSGTDPCSSTFRWLEGDGAFLTGSRYQEWVAWRVRAVEDQEAYDRAARGRAIAQEKAAREKQAASAQSTRSVRPYTGPTSSSVGSGTGSGATSARGVSGGGGKTGGGGVSGGHHVSDPN